MTEEEKEKAKDEIIAKYQEKWSALGLTSGLESDNTNWLNNYQNHNFSGTVDSGTSLTTSNQSFDTIQFPMVRRVMAATLAGGGTYKSSKQQLKENRMNKLRKLQGEEANITLPDDVIVEGLVSVQPMSGPVGNLLYMDYKYGETDEEKRIKKQNIRKEKLEQLFRKDKIKYIVETLKNNLKKWMT